MEKVCCAEAPSGVAQLQKSGLRALSQPEHRAKGRPFLGPSLTLPRLPGSLCPLFSHCVRVDGAALPR